ncbi:uncharacterized protein DS421_12g361940 [Arachis hypogaea]|nr:uncharacterized protein DS421_12g361940 [Arachis hypogaea]
MQNLAAEKQRPMPKTTLVEKIPAKIIGGLVARAEARRAPNLPLAQPTREYTQKLLPETRHFILVARQTRAGAEPRTICSTRRFRLRRRIAQRPTVVPSPATKLSISLAVREIPTPSSPVRES